MFMTLFHVAVGGAIGSVLRYLSVAGIGTPIGTMVVNILGSFAMGVLFVVLANRTALSPLLMTGVLGLPLFRPSRLTRYDCGTAGPPCRPHSTCWARSSCLFLRRPSVLPSPAEPLHE
jgi:hypothetical protein